MCDCTPTVKRLHRCWLLTCVVCSALALSFGVWLGMLLLALVQ